MKPFVVFVEGSVGAGKTTLIQLLEKEFKTLLGEGHVKIVLEPLHKWQEIVHKDKNFLELSYKEAEKYGMLFQIKALSDMEMEHMQEQQERIVIYERCPKTTVEVFAKKLQREGTISELEYTVLDELLETFQKTGKLVKPDITIYLKTSTETTNARISKRNREEESEVTKENIKVLNTIYNEYIEGIKNEVTIVDANLEAEEVMNMAKNAIISAMNEEDDNN